LYRYAAIEIPDNLKPKFIPVLPPAGSGNDAEVGLYTRRLPLTHGRKAPGTQVVSTLAPIK
jgi:hypothetical protein